MISLEIAKQAGTWNGPSVLSILGKKMRLKCGCSMTWVWSKISASTFFIPLLRCPSWLWNLMLKVFSAVNNWHMCNRAIWCYIYSSRAVFNNGSMSSMTFGRKELRVQYVGASTQIKWQTKLAPVWKMSLTSLYCGLDISFLHNICFGLWFVGLV